MLLTKEQEIDLSIRIRSAYNDLEIGERLGFSDEVMSHIKSHLAEVRNELVSHNYGLVYKIAKSFGGRGVDVDDLVNEGIFGLIRACQDFDPKSHNTNFSTYAVPWVKQYIRRAIGSQSRTIRVPDWANTEITRWNQSEEVLTHELGRKPNDDEIGDSIGLTKREMKLIRPSVNRKMNSLFMSSSESDQECEYLGKCDDIDLDNVDGLVMDNLMELIYRLDERSREVLILRYGVYDEPKNLREIGEILGISRERVRQIQEESLERIRELVGQLQLSY